MGKRRSEKTPSQRSTPSRPSRQERRQAARNDARAQRTVNTTSSLTAVPSYSRQDVLALLALGLLVAVCYLPAMLWGGFVWDDSILTDAKSVQDVSDLWQRSERRSGPWQHGHRPLLLGQKQRGAAKLRPSAFPQSEPRNRACQSRSSAGGDRRKSSVTRRSSTSFQGMPNSRRYTSSA